MTEIPKIYIVDDDEAIRNLLGLIMHSENLPFELYSSAEEFLAQVTPAIRGCLILDVTMPGISGLQLLERLRQKYKTLPIIIMTGYADVAMAVKAMKMGAIDFIEKPFNNAKLLRVLYSCLAYCESLQHDQNEKEECARRLERLTKRERQVMDLLVEGYKNKVIATRLNISPRTVELHRARVMEKLEVRSLSEVVRIALTASEHSDITVYKQLERVS